MVKIKDVAQHAGVSSATVSRVLNGDAGVAAVSRERVLASVRELGYRPNRVARNLRRQQTETIGVVVSEIENPHFTQAVRVIEDAAFRQGYRVILCNTDETPAKQRAYLEMLAAERVRGVILAPADAADPMIGQLLALGVPIVAFDRGVDDPLADAVIADNHSASRRAVRHLRDVGRRHIGFIGGRPEIQTGRERLAGYVAAMEELQQEPRWLEGAFRVEGAHLATQRMLSDAPEVDGLVVANNLMAIGALKALRQSGRRVGDDIGLVAFDDPVWAEFVDPPITVLVQPVRRMAAQAVELLFERIAGTRTQPRTVIFTFELRVRESCGKLPRIAYESAAVAFTHGE
jgi:DNA-binding LacI/PurR family transcriptional regulator